MFTAHRSARMLLGLVMLTAVGGLLGCSAIGYCDNACDAPGLLPPNLPDDPEPCTKYCKVWVPPVYRPKPCVVQKRPGYTKCVEDCVLKTEYQEVCVKPRESYRVCEPDHACEQAVVQATPGGYKWKDAGCGCYRYCYEPPCYQWCNKVVTEEGIDYCTEIPPEYRVRVRHRPKRVVSQQYVPAEYGVVWKKECFQPGRWEWQPIKECPSCDCPQEPCPQIPFRPQPCRAGVLQTCPTTN